MEYGKVKEKSDTNAKSDGILKKAVSKVIFSESVIAGLPRNLTPQPPKGE